MSKTPTYETWVNMRNRCNRPECRGYERYGGAGIAVCDEWASSFENFLADMGAKPPGTSLDRIDPKGNYSKRNCRWASQEMQSNNRKSVKSATLNGVTKPLAVWCRELGLNHKTVRARVYQLGWTPERALRTPVR